jgi:hypothetical protein
MRYTPGAAPPGRPRTATDQIEDRALELRDSGRSLRAVGQQLREEFPDTLDAAPAASTVTTWAQRAETRWAQYLAEIAPPVVRARKARRLNAIMGRLAQAVDSVDPDDLPRMVEYVKAHVLLEREESRALLPNRIEVEPVLPPAVHGPTRQAIEAALSDPPPVTPIRRTS